MCILYQYIMYQGRQTPQKKNGCSSSGWWIRSIISSWTNGCHSQICSGRLGPPECHPNAARIGVEVFAHGIHGPKHDSLEACQLWWKVPVRIWPTGACTSWARTGMGQDWSLRFVRDAVTRSWRERGSFTREEQERIYQDDSFVEENHQHNSNMFNIYISVDVSKTMTAVNLLTSPQLEGTHPGSQPKHPTRTVKCLMFVDLSKQQNKGYRKNQ